MDKKKQYKDSPYGPIPQEWKVLPVGEAFEIHNNLRFPISEEERNKIRGSYPYYGPTKIQDYINEYRVEGKFSIIGEDGDHFLKWKELPMTLLIEGQFNVNNHAHLIQGKNNLTEWFFYFFNHRELTPYLTRQGAGRYKLTKDALTKIPCLIPPINEQKTITKCISIWDNAIIILQNIIDQKDKQKKWLISMLLSGKKRLKGFKGEWKIEVLDNLVELKHGYQFREEDFVEAGIPVIKIRNVIGTQLELSNLTYVNKDRLNEFSDVIIKNGDLLMSLTGNIGRVVEVSEVATPLFQNYRVGKFVPKDNQLFKSFLKFILASDFLLNQFNGLANQSAQANFGKQDMNKLKIRFPISLEEQSAIAVVLQNSEREIQILKNKCDQLKEQKKGLMQILLTGKKRLKIE